jgi:hypothetical protein
VYQAMYDAISPIAKIKDPRKRFRAFIREYVAFALNQPEMYRLALMSDPKFSDVLLRDAPIEGAGGPGQKTFALMVNTMAELRRKEAGAFALAEMVWVAVHGLVSLKIVCHAYPVTPVNALADTLADTLLSGILHGKP